MLSINKKKQDEFFTFMVKNISPETFIEIDRIANDFNKANVEAAAAKFAIDVNNIWEKQALRTQARKYVPVDQKLPDNIEEDTFHIVSNKRHNQRAIDRDYRGNMLAAAKRESDAIDRAQREYEQRNILVKQVICDDIVAENERKQACQLDLANTLVE
jgi:hypothetical protein